uniref:Cobalamin-binding protein n=1 Tax=candidate division WOR-3 bacterium TaxID=2052148 RepID=A0A7C3UXZ4_UNCW3
MRFSLLLLSFLLFCARTPERKIPLRVVSLVPSITEIIYALGKGGCLVGNTVYCDYPEEAKKVYKVGDFANPSLEKIYALKPDIVFLTLPTQKIIQEKLVTLGIKTFVSSPKDFPSLLSEIREISRILGEPKRGESLTLEMAEKIKEFAFPPKRIYVEISPQPLVTIGNNSFLSDVLERCGLKNIFSDLPEEYPIVKIEEIIKKDPEIILILHPLAKREDVKKRIGFEKMKAVKEGKIITDINPDLLLRPGPRIILGLEKLLNEI